MEIAFKIYFALIFIALLNTGFMGVFLNGAVFLVPRILSEWFFGMIFRASLEIHHEEKKLKNFKIQTRYMISKI